MSPAGDTCEIADSAWLMYAICASGLAQIGQFGRPQLGVAIACMRQSWQREEHFGAPVLADGASRHQGGISLTGGWAVACCGLAGNGRGA
jgi:hypothetical protein